MVEPSEGFLEKDTKEYVNTSEQLAIEVLQNADDKITPNVLLAAKIIQCEVMLTFVLFQTQSNSTDIKNNKILHH